MRMIMNLRILLASLGPEQVEHSQTIETQVNNIVTIKVGKPHLWNLLVSLYVRD